LSIFTYLPIENITIKVFFSFEILRSEKKQSNWLHKKELSIRCLFEIADKMKNHLVPSILVDYFLNDENRYFSEFLLKYR